MGEDLENKYQGLAGTLLGVKKTFTPQPTHLVLKRIKRNGVIEADSLAAPKGYVLPTLLRSGAIDQEMPGAPLPKIGWTRKDMDEARATFLPENEDDPLKTVKSAFANFVYVPRHDLPDSVKANPGPEDYAARGSVDRSVAPQIDSATREAKYAAWKRAVAAAQSA